MDLKRLPSSSWLYRTVLAAWIASAIIVMFLLSEIDRIVNVELYKHGLQFSNDWANPYWTYLNLNYIALSVPVALSLFAIVIRFIPRIRKVGGSIAGRLRKFQPVGSILKIKKASWEIAKRKAESQPRAFQEQKRQESSGESIALEEANKPSAADFSCPSCGKTFGRPIIMFDFEGGKRKLVNVCPYCNHVLGSAHKESFEIDMQIADIDGKLTRESAEA